MFIMTSTDQVRLCSGLSILYRVTVLEHGKFSQISVFHIFLSSLKIMVLMIGYNFIMTSYRSSSNFGVV